jgi:hypothetical protein
LIHNFREGENWCIIEEYNKVKNYRNFPLTCNPTKILYGQSVLMKNTTTNKSNSSFSSNRSMCKFWFTIIFHHSGTNGFNGKSPQPRRGVQGTLLRKATPTTTPSAPKPVNLKSKKAEAGTLDLFTATKGNIVKGSHWGGAAASVEPYVAF